MRTDYEALARQPESSTADPSVLQAALALNEARKQATAIELAVNQVAKVDAIVTDGIGLLRSARKAEAKAKAYLRAVGAAADAFKVTGDFAAFSAAQLEARTAFLRTS